MKKFIPYILILIVIGVFIPTQFASAQAASAAASVAATIAGKITGFVGGNIFAPVLEWLFFLVQKITALFMGISGLLLNFVIQTTIIDMSKNISGMTGINIAWKIIRDLMNIVFIFLLVYEGIKLIIGVGSITKIRNFVGFLVLASLLINFSLFFTKILIDASNIVTIGLYKTIVDPNTFGNDPTQVTVLGGLSNAYQQALGLQGFFSPKVIDLANDKDNYTGMVGNMMASILFLITAFVFFAVSILLVIRYIVLIFLLMLSPIAYMGMALPSMKGYATKWWDSLKGQLLFAPIFMLMTWVVLTLINSSGFLGKNLDSTAWANLQKVQSGTNIGASISLLFNFALVIGLTILSLIIAKDTAKKGATIIGQATNNLTSFAGGAVMGESAKVFRGTVGLAGQTVANNQWLKERSPDSRIARMALSAGAKTGSASMDVRATGLGKVMGTGKAGGKGGYEAEREEKIRKRMQFAETTMQDTITGTDVEREMERRGYGKAENERLGRTPYEVEAMRRRVQLHPVHGLVAGATANTRRRQERYLHNLSQTNFMNPGLYSGVSENAEAARRMREGKKAKKGGKDKVLADLAAILKEEEPGTGGAPVVPPVVPPAVVPPVPPAGGPPPGP